MTKIAVLGPRGRLGSFLAANGAVPVEVDITCPPLLKEARLDDYDVVINCAGKTNVDDCQQREGQDNPTYLRALQVNSHALEYVRRAFSGRLIHISTDYVFKCDRGPYIENDKRNPVNDYGFTKLGGEVILETYPFDFETVIVRTTGLYGSERDFASFVKGKLHRAESFVAASNLQGNQTYIPHLAEALFAIAQMKYMPDVITHVHVASRNLTTRYGFACLLAERFGYPSGEYVQACRSADIPAWVAPRPTRGGLLLHRAEGMGLPLYTIEEGIDAYARRPHP